MAIMSAQGDQEDWTRHRQEVFEAKEQALRAARQAEHEKATTMIREAITRFREAGIAPVPSGRSRTPAPARSALRWRAGT